MIRPFKPDDISQCIELWKKTDLLYEPIDKPENLIKKSELEPDMFLVEEVDNKIIGTVIGQFDGWWASIFHVAVDPEHQSKGIGKKLMGAMEKTLKDKGAENVVIFRVSDEPNDGFYTKIGYRKVYDIQSWIKRL